MEYLQLELIEKTICSKWHFDSLYPLNKYWVLAIWIPDSSYWISDLSYSGFQSLVGFRTLNSTRKYFWDSGSHKQNFLGSRIPQAKFTGNPLVDLGEGPGGLFPLPPFFRLNWGPKGRKTFGRLRPPIAGCGWPGPLPILRSQGLEPALRSISCP